jgi:NADPH:quinone reductase-like Zn-dependent oxidoreductase
MLLILLQAYYILIEISKLTEENSVLVHSGLTAVGRAAIDICLEKKCQVFVTVSDSKQMELLKERFPSVYYYIDENQL